MIGQRHELSSPNEPETIQRREIIMLKQAVTAEPVHMQQSSKMRWASRNG